MAIKVYLDKEEELHLQELAGRVGVSYSLMGKLLLERGLANSSTNDKEFKRIAKELEENIKADIVRVRTQAHIKRAMLAINQGRLLSKLQAQGLPFDKLAELKTMLWKEAKARGWTKKDWEQSIMQASNIIIAEDSVNIDKLIKRKG